VKGLFFNLRGNPFETPRENKGGCTGLYKEISVRIGDKSVANLPMKLNQKYKRDG
jgi:hypothetical protein